MDKPINRRNMIAATAVGAAGTLLAKEAAAETTASRQQDYITLARDHTRKLWAAINDLEGMQNEWSAQDYSNNLDDGTGANEGVTAADVGAVVNTSISALRTWLAAGHATNFTNLL